MRGWPVSDDIRGWSDTLARDPSSVVFLQLGEALRRQGQRDVALQVALRGLERHPHLAEAHDLLARIAADEGDLQRAFDEWDMVLRLSPRAAGALKGMGFVRYRQGELAEAERYLAEALEADGEDPSIAAALGHVRAALAAQRGGEESAEPLPPIDDGMPADATPVAESEPAEVGMAESGDPRLLFQDIMGDGRQAALLLDASGLVLAGAYVVEDGEDVAQAVGAELSGVSDEARRAMRHLGLGDWSSLTVETDAAVVAMAPMRDDALVLVAASKAMPLGLVHRVLDRCVERATGWLAKGGA